MKNMIKLSFLATTSLLFVSCGHSIKTSGNPIPHEVKKVYLVSDRSLDSDEVHNEIKKQLQKSQYDVVDLRDNKHEKVNGVVVHYNDIWGWDMSMLIRDLNINIMHGESNRKISSTVYHQTGPQGGSIKYPSIEYVVSKTFDRMRQDSLIK